MPHPTWNWWSNASIVIIAVKPQNIDDLLDELSSSSHEGHLFISIAAGITTEKLAAKMHHQSGIIRVMPNAPASVLAGIAAMCPGPECFPVRSPARRFDFRVRRARGESSKTKRLMDVVTGLSGSGPAFVFLVIESLSDAGVQLGISRKESSLLAAQTVYGAAKMLLETGKHPSELKDIVATPGGTTFAGLKMLEKGNFRSTIMEAVEAATARSRELGSLINGRKRRPEVTLFPYISKARCAAEALKFEDVFQVDPFSGRISLGNNRYVMSRCGRPRCHASRTHGQPWMGRDPGSF